MSGPRGRQGLQGLGQQVLPGPSPLGIRRDLHPRPHSLDPRLSGHRPAGCSQHKGLHKSEKSYLLPASPLNDHGAVSIGGKSHLTVHLLNHCSPNAFCPHVIYQGSPFRKCFCKHRTAQSWRGHTCSQVRTPDSQDPLSSCHQDPLSSSWTLFSFLCPCKLGAHTRPSITSTQIVATREAWDGF